jgi:hypothetical protein
MKTLSTIFLSTLFVVLAPNSGNGENTFFVAEVVGDVSPLSVGIDSGDGSGFSFFPLSDDDNDGMIRLPDLPLGGRLALGVPHAVTDPCCLIWQFSGTEVASAGLMIEYPLLSNFSTGASLGIDYGEIAAPPIALTPGDEFAVTGGVLPGWPGIRLVDDSGVPGLPEFVAAVDGLPAFEGDVVVSDVLVRFTVVPEPASVLLLLLVAMGIAVCQRTALRRRGATR